MCKRLIHSISPLDILVCVSEATRQDVLELTELRDNQVFVVPNGVDLNVFRPVQKYLEAKLRAQYQLNDSPFVFSYSSLAPHKNLDLILEIWPTVVAHLPESLLVLAGGKGEKITTHLTRMSKQAQDSIRIVGRVPDQTIAALCSACSSFLFPSFYEGFGLPVLEAMACGASVIASNNSSLPEVSGQQARLIDPKQRDAWIDAITESLSSTRSQLEREQTIAHARQYTWQRAAAGYLNIYRQVTQDHPSNGKKTRRG